MSRKNKALSPWEATTMEATRDSSRGSFLVELALLERILSHDTFPFLNLNRSVSSSPLLSIQEQAKKKLFWSRLIRPFYLARGTNITPRLAVSFHLSVCVSSPDAGSNFLRKNHHYSLFDQTFCLYYRGIAGKLLCMHALVCVSTTCKVTWVVVDIVLPGPARAVVSSQLLTGNKCRPCWAMFLRTLASLSYKTCKFKPSHSRGLNSHHPSLHGNEEKRCAENRTTRIERNTNGIKSMYAHCLNK